MERESKRGADGTYTVHGRTGMQGNLDGVIGTRPPLESAIFDHVTASASINVFFFFFEFHLCAPRGTEPHVALREYT